MDFIKPNKFSIKKNVAVNMFVKLLAEIIDFAETEQLKTLIVENTTMVDVLNDHIYDLTRQGLIAVVNRNIDFEMLKEWYDEEFENIVQKTFKTSKKLKQLDVNINRVLDWVSLNLEEWYNDMVIPVASEVIT